MADGISPKNEDEQKAKTLAELISLVREQAKPADRNERRFAELETRPRAIFGICSGLLPGVVSLLNDPEIHRRNAIGAKQAERALFECLEPQALAYGGLYLGNMPNV